jgi:hypothetical protein
MTIPIIPFVHFARFPHCFSYSVVFEKKNYTNYERKSVFFFLLVIFTMTLLCRVILFFTVCNGRITDRYTVYTTL